MHCRPGHRSPQLGSQPHLPIPSPLIPSSRSEDGVDYLLNTQLYGTYFVLSTVVFYMFLLILVLNLIIVTLFPFVGAEIGIGK